MNLIILNDKIKETKITETEIADKMGISPRILKLKLSGKKGFYVSEINLLSEILDLSYEEQMYIFLEKRVT